MSAASIADAPRASPTPELGERGLFQDTLGPLRTSTPIFPVSRTTLYVSDCHNHDLGGPEPIDHMVRKPGNQRTTGVTVR